MYATVYTPRSIAYFRSTRTDGPSVAAEATHRLEEYARVELPHVAWAGVWLEDAGEWRKGFGHRPVGFRLGLELEPGDHLVLPSLARTFRDGADFVEAVRRCGANDVFMHVLDPRVNSWTPEGRGALAALVGAARQERERTAERAAEGNATRRARGLATTGSAPYGFRLVGPKGRRRLVPDAHVRNVGRHIVSWRLKGYAWEAIVLHLLRLGVANGRGEEWTYGTVRRAFVGESLLQAREKGQRPVGAESAAPA